MELSKRLKTVADAVTPGKKVADIGTDHGFVPIYLVKNQICPQAVAMDVGKGPLERAREHIEEEKLSGKIKTRLSDGLSRLSPKEADSIIMAGMGGALICRILQNTPVFTDQGKELILQPQSEWNKVRRYLEIISYRIEKEWFLQEEGKYYVVIKALPGEKKKQKAGVFESQPDKKESEAYKDYGVSPEFLYEYGTYLLDEQNPVFMEYLSKKCAKMKMITKKIENAINEDAAKSEQTRQRLEEICNEIKEIEKIIKPA